MGQIDPLGLNGYENGPNNPTNKPGSHNNDDPVDQPSTRPDAQETADAPATQRPKDDAAKVDTDRNAGRKGDDAATSQPKISDKISPQKQDRHIEGHPGYRHGGTMASRADAQKVLDAFHQGEVIVLGYTKNGSFPVVRCDSVTGIDNNPRAGRLGVPTNVFIIKGTVSPSIVPTNPNWKP